MSLDLQHWQRIQAEIALDRLLEEWVEPDDPESHGRPFPMSRVPPEIISEIFLHCLPFGVDTPLPSEAPLLLCQISSQWRDIALSTPGLWSEISLLDPRSQGICLLLNTWLSRARRCPLSISIRWRKPGLRGVLSAAVWSAMEPFSHQLQSLTLAGCFREFTHFPFIQHRLPSLKSLTMINLGLGGSDGSDRLLDDITVFNEAPLLDTVSLDGDGCMGIPLPWVYLKGISLSDLPIDMCLQCMQRAFNITRCTLFRPRHLNATHQLEAIPALEHLHVLSLMEGWQDGILLAALTLPALRMLGVSVRADDSPNFMSFLTRSNAQLRFLRLTTDLDEGFILQCFNHPSATSLEELELYFEIGFPTPSILRVLRDDPLLLPKLQRLLIVESPSHSPPTDSYETVLLDFLASRRASNHHFTSFNLRTKHHFPIPDVEKLCDLLKTRMSVTVERFFGSRNTGIYERMWKLEE
ncbi:hypothetical protein B0H11DRAFT_2096527 [Mycena galericulata]|nr:hypothetical protein B0H11DRAFT_2096527 [Mycena galericulata]